MLVHEAHGNIDTMNPPERLQRLLPAFVFASAAFLVVLPLLVQGCSCGHDFDFHLLSWMEAGWQWQHGILKPVWAFTAAYNAGEPRFLFYPPLSWATGAFLGLLLPWKFVPAAFTWLVLFLCGLTMHHLLRRWVSPSVATLGGCLYMVNPYMLFNAYERTAYAELMAAAWMPLLLAALLRARVSLWYVALPVALLWLTNAPAAVVGCYSLVFLAGLRLLMERRDGIAPALSLATAITSGVLVALLLDAFYLVPLLTERRFVQLAMAVVPIARPDHNFLFGYDPDAAHTHVLVQASWIAIGIIATALLCGGTLLFRRQRGGASFPSVREGGGPETPRDTVLILALFSLVILALLTPWSASFWHIAPEVVFLQFPWRFLTAESAVSVVLLCMLVQALVPRAHTRILLSAGVFTAALAGWFAGGMYFREGCDDAETVQAQRNAYVHRAGVEPTDEYTPVTADNDALHAHLPPAWMTDEAGADPPRSRSEIEMNDRDPRDERLTTPATDKDYVIVRLRKFAGWHVFRDGSEIDPDTRDDGLMIVPVARGQAHHIEVLYRTTMDQWVGMAVSGAAFLSVAAARWRRRFGMMKYP